MEHDMNEVSVGNKTKAEVLETCLQQMKACFLDVSELFRIYYCVFSLWLNLFSAEAVANAMAETECHDFIFVIHKINPRRPE